MRSGAVLAGTVLTAVLVTGCIAAVPNTADPDAGEAQPHPRAAGAFYRPPSPLPSAVPGTLISSQAVHAPHGTRGWRILYHSRSLPGRDIAVSGSVFVPGSPAAGRSPRAGRRVVAWAHGTIGSGDSCAPSTDPDPLNGIEDGAALLAAGDTIVATDYEGLGTPGPHPYMVGVSEARSVLDAVRAAARLPGSGIGRSFVVFGHSQGGQAALFTGEIAASYAPDLRLLGVAAAAPPTDLPAILTNLDRLDYGTAYLVEAAAGYSAIDPGAQVRSIMTPGGAADLHLVEDGCTDDLVTAYTGHSAHQVFSEDPRTTPPWSTAFAANSTGLLPRGLPLLIMQGGKDPIVPASVTTAAVSRMREGGDSVDYHLYPTAAHNVVPSATGDLIGWLTARFAAQER